ncbi:MAG: redox-regulated ATPase YchF, partial [Clostridiales bacterium]|nr:redox-regulated ATPase YchF [Clostridiales bacterium]
MKLGIVGLPNVGKSTLFNSLTQAGAESANYPFCTINPNVGIVNVPDGRLYELDKIYHSEKIVHAVIEFVDIAGLVRGASKGEGLGNQFLSHIREVDAVLHVVRCFDDDNVTHVDNTIDPIRDIETINLELIFSDLEILERRFSKINRSVKNDKAQQKEFEFLQRLIKNLEDGRPARKIDVDEEEAEILSGYNLLTAKKVVYAANVLENGLIDDGHNNPYVKKVREMANEEGSEVFVVC